MPQKNNVQALTILFILLVVSVIYYIWLAKNGVFIRNSHDRYLAMKLVNQNFTFFASKRRTPKAQWRIDLFNKTLFNVKYQTLVYWQVSPEPNVYVYQQADAQQCTFNSVPGCPFAGMPISFGSKKQQYYVDSKDNEISLVSKPHKSSMWYVCLRPAESNDSSSGSSSDSGTGTGSGSDTNPTSPTTSDTD